MSEDYSIEKVKPSQLKEMIEDLKRDNNPKNLITTFQFLERVCDEAGMYSDIISLVPFLLTVIRKHSNLRVRVHALNLLTTVSCSVENSNLKLVSNTAFSMSLNLFQKVEYPANIEILNAIISEFNKVPTLNWCVSMINTLTAVLASQKVVEKAKGDLVNILMDMLYGDFFSAGFIGCGGTEENEGGEVDASSSFSVSASSSVSTSSSSSSSSLPSDFVSVEISPIFMFALSKLFIVIRKLGLVARGQLRGQCIGLASILEDRFGKKVSVEFKMVEEQEKEINKDGIDIVFSPQPARAGVRYTGPRIFFSRPKDMPLRTVVIHEDLSSHPNRVFLLNVVVYGDLNIGVAVKAAFPGLYDAHIYSRTGTAMLYFDGIVTGEKFVAGGFRLWDADTPDMADIRMELDQKTHTLYWHAGKTRLTHCVTNVPTDVFFAVADGGSHLPSSMVEVRSFQSFPASSSSFSSPASSSLPSLMKYNEYE